MEKGVAIGINGLDRIITAPCLLAICWSWARHGQKLEGEREQEWDQGDDSIDDDAKLRACVALRRRHSTHHKGHFVCPDALNWKALFFPNLPSLSFILTYQLLISVSRGFEKPVYFQSVDLNSHRTLLRQWCLRLQNNSKNNLSFVSLKLVSKQRRQEADGIQK